MAERSIILRQDEIPGILDGTKTQVRRPVPWRPRKPGSNIGSSGLQLGPYANDNPGTGYVLRSRDGGGRWNDRTFPEHSPFGKPGDLLWGRETWQVASWHEGDPIIIQYKDGKRQSDQSDVTELEYEEWYERMWEQSIIDCKTAGLTTDDDGMFAWEGENPTRWRPSTQMPKWACRIWLKVKRVWVERLHDLSEDDAVAMGATRREIKGQYGTRGGWAGDWSSVGEKGWNGKPLTEGEICFGSPQMAVANAWEKDYAAKGYGWNKNPWAWCCEFEMVKR